MIGADTNILARFLVNDVGYQADLVIKKINEGEIFYINEVILSELYWVLTHAYEYSKNDFIRTIDTLLETKGFLFFNSQIVKLSLSDFIHTSVGFTDCLIHRINNREGLNTLTFDKKASRLKHMKLFK